MQVECLQENLKNGLRVVGRAAATKPVLPITQNVLLSVDESRLKLTCTNLEVAISTWVGADVQEDGDTTVPASLLSDFVSTLPDGRVQIATDTEGNRLRIECGRFKAGMNMVPARDYPPIPSIEDECPVSIDPDVFREAIQKTVIASATDDVRPVLAGVHFDIQGDRFTMAGADGFRLAIYEGSLIDAGQAGDRSFIVPYRSLQEVMRLIRNQEDPVEIMVTETRAQALFKLDNVEVVTQLVAGTFPDYRALVPTDSTAQMIVNREALVQAVKTVGIFARGGSNIIRLNVEGEDDESREIVLSARAEEYGANQVTVPVVLESEQEEVKIAFNERYLRDVLVVMDDTDIVLELSTTSRPGVVRPVDETRGHKYTHVVMPMFVQW